MWVLLFWGGGGGLAQSQVFYDGAYWQLSQGVREGQEQRHVFCEWPLTTHASKGFDMTK
jgi:hypothetical protein